MRESRTCADCRCDACARCRIVGCGYAGAAAALFLERAGHAVTIYEEVAAPRAIGAGIVLRPTGMYVLDRLGLLDPVLARGAPLDGSSRAERGTSFRDVLSWVQPPKAPRASLRPRDRGHAAFHHAACANGCPHRRSVAGAT